jgi:glutathione S-transferase
MAGASSRLQLYSAPLSMFGAKAEIAVREKGLDYDLTMVPFDMQRLYEPRHPEILRVNPKRQVPVLIHDRVEIFDSTQIFEYLEDLKPEPTLWPQAVPARAHARLLEHKSDEVYFPPVIRLMGLQQTPGDPAAVTARDAVTRFYGEMEQVLGNGEYLAGAYTYADIAFYMAQIFGARMGAPMTDATPHLLDWRERVGARPAVRHVAGGMARWLLSIGRPIPDFMQRLV